MTVMTLGIDYGDEAVRAVVVNNGGQVLARADLPASPTGPQALREAVRRARGGARTNITAVGVATPWPGDPLPPDVAAGLADLLPDVPITGIAAGPAAAIAEVWCGAARNLKNVLAFSMGEHVTAGIMLRGEIWTGANGYAGSVAWLALNPVEREDYRRYGGLEAEIASAGIVRRFIWRIKAGDRSAIVDQSGGDFSRITADQIFAAARSGDGVSISVIRDTAKYVGMAIANLATVIDPEAIVLGGTLAASGDMMLEAIRVECTRRLSPVQGDRVKVVLSTLGGDAVAIGAARAAAIHAK
jgi:glucokinase